MYFFFCFWEKKEGEKCEGKEKEIQGKEVKSGLGVSINAGLKSEF